MMQVREVNIGIDIYRTQVVPLFRDLNSGE